MIVYESYVYVCIHVNTHKNFMLLLTIFYTNWFSFWYLTENA